MPGFLSRACITPSSPQLIPTMIPFQLSPNCPTYDNLLDSSRLLEGFGYSAYITIQALRSRVAPNNWVPGSRRTPSRHPHQHQRGQGGTGGGVRRDRDGGGDKLNTPRFRKRGSLMGSILNGTSGGFIMCSTWISI